MSVQQANRLRGSQSDKWVSCWGILASPAMGHWGTCPSSPV